MCPLREKVYGEAMNKDLQRRAAKCDLGVRQRTTDDGLWEWPGSDALHESPPDYDDWNNVMRLRDLAIAKAGVGDFAMHLGDGIWHCAATKEQIVEASVLTLEAT